jgi:DNA-binding helix-hairpin-helix protein with protein kinase domain/predicted RNA-binding Zn-ribbon protein involved in translation (DUF1610 family)
MTEKRVNIAGKPAELTRRIGRGGEGDVFLVSGRSDIAVKLYTTKKLEDRAAKIKALVAANVAQKEPLVAFPLGEVTSPSSGRFLGFAMRLFDGCKPLHELYASGSRKIHFPQADYRFLVRSASNIARAMAAVHRSGCVIGDINHSGILVSPKAMVALIDADSFQFSSDSEKYLCKVGVPEYTPPELQGSTLAGIFRTPNHDAFGLAVVIFQLLFMGRHPFVGTVRKGEIPPIHENIANRRYVYTDTKNVGMDQPPGTPSIDDFYPPLASLFDEAFLSIENRPSAERWIKTLESLEASLVKCQDNELHYIPKDSSECAWCEMERQTGTVLFIPFIPAGQPIKGVDPGSEKFNVEAIWQSIEAVHSAVNLSLRPKIQTYSVSPSEAAVKAKDGLEKWNWVGLAMIAGAIVGLIAAPKGFIIWLILAFAGYPNVKTRKSLDPNPFTSEYIAIEKIYQREIQNWEKRNGVEDFQRLYAELEAARDEYHLIKRLEANEVARHGQQRFDAQINAYLDTYPLEQANIRGIGPAIRATLASYGVSTAADISLGRLQTVPGVGDKISEKLLSWRKKIESQFVYRPSASSLDQAVTIQARTKAEAKLVPIRAKLIAGPQNLSALAGRMQAIASTEDVVLARAAKARDQAKCDLKFLGIPVPSVSGPQRQPNGAAVVHSQPAPFQAYTQRPSSSQRATVPAGIPAKNTNRSSSVNCPRCGNSMVRRLARRGRKVGSYFWGCSRYPVCKGTRTI